jgi:hypothetical protein
MFEMILFIVAAILQFFAGTNLALDPSNIKSVLVVSSEHFDAGFSDTAANVLNRYFEVYFPNVATRTDPTISSEELDFKFMFQPYTLAMFLNCPPSIPGLRCPNETNSALVKSALERGSIWLNGFPTNAELALMSPTLITASIESVVGDITRKYGNKDPPKTLSQRDVPGLPRSIIPILRSSGIELISIGVNGGSAPPEVPAAFRWRDTVSGQDIVVIVHPLGYGCTDTTCNQIEQAVYIPGMSSVLIPWWKGDFEGPPNKTQIETVFSSLRYTYPNAVVKFSTFDDWVTEMLPYRNTLPVVEKEIADTWVYGVPSDPLKVAVFRAMQREFDSSIASGESSLTDPRVANFTRLFLKNGEHTWGKDVKKFLNDTQNWWNEQFSAMKGEPNFIDIVESWKEQRRWGIDYPLEALEDHPLAERIRREIARLYPSDDGAYPKDGRKILSPDDSGYLIFKEKDQFSGKYWSIYANPKHGGINIISYDNSSLLSVSPDIVIGGLFYQLYSQSDYTQFTSAYNTVDEYWVKASAFLINLFWI